MLYLPIPKRLQLAYDSGSFFFNGPVHHSTELQFKPSIRVTEIKNVFLYNFEAPRITYLQVLYTTTLKKWYIHQRRK
jgi:hypothetical protein